jgi:hypothetical protein
LSARASAFSESERAIPPGVTRGGDGVGTLITRFCHPPQRLVFGIKGFECSTPLVVPPLVESTGHRPLQPVDLGFQSGVPGDLPPPLQPVLQAYLILNASWYWGPWVVTRATLGSRCCKSLQNGAGEVLNAHVDCHPIVGFRIERTLVFQVSLEVGPVSAPEIRAIRWVMKG